MSGSNNMGLEDGETHDYVGVVMAKSAEGDAVADVMRRIEGVEIIEQPSFWEIRAEHRMTISFEAVSEELGFEVDGSDLQREMSTNYGRMINTDDALLMFSDPVEAMEHLM